MTNTISATTQNIIVQNVNATSLTCNASFLVNRIETTNNILINTLRTSNPDPNTGITNNFGNFIVTNGIITFGS